MLSTTFTIFNATKSLPPRSNLPAWANGQQTWPQITLLCIACVSLAICIIVFYSYWKGGHRKAGKAAFYHTVFSIGIFVFSTVMWVFAAAMLHSSKQNGQGQDMWGWSCNQNKRSSLFQDEVNYTLVCRLQVSCTYTTFPPTSMLTTPPRTGPSSAPSSRSPSRSSPSSFTPSSCTDSSPSAACTRP